MNKRLSLIGSGLRLMTRREAIAGSAIVALMMLTGLLESATIAMVVPITYIIIDPSRFSNSGVGKKIVELFGVHSVQDIFLYVAGIFVVLLIVTSLLSTGCRFLSEAHSVRCVNRMARNVLERCLNGPYLWLVKQNTSTIIHYVLDDVAAWRANFIGPLFLGLQAAIMIVSPVAVAMVIAPFSALIAIFVVAAIAVSIVLAFRGRIRELARRQRNLKRKMVVVLSQIIFGFREIRVSNQSSYFMNLFHHSNSAFNWAGITLRIWNEVPGNIVTLLGQIGFIVTAAILFITKAPGADITAQLALIGVVVTRVLPAINRLIGQLPIVARSMPSVEALVRLVAELDGLERRSRRHGAMSLSSSWRKMAVKDIWFRYAEEMDWTLKDVSLELERGKFYGFVGRSGAGKSTLANLLLGLIEPNQGVVTVDGRPLEEISIADWQGRFGYVPQDPFILDGTIRENIVFGDVCGETQLNEAIAHARLMNGIGQFENGLETRVGERGRQLSGGQMQRVAIARALVRQPEIFFLDEATSALDSVTEGEFYDAVRTKRGDVTAIIIAHRISSLRFCDRIFVLDKGQIVARGTYDELLATSPIFRSLAAHVDEAKAAADRAASADVASAPINA